MSELQRRASSKFSVIHIETQSDSEDSELDTEIEENSVYFYKNNINNNNSNNVAFGQATNHLASRANINSTRADVDMNTRIRNICNNSDNDDKNCFVFSRFNSFEKIDIDMINNSNDSNKTNNGLFGMKALTKLHAVERHFPTINNANNRNSNASSIAIAKQNKSSNDSYFGQVSSKLNSNSKIDIDDEIIKKKNVINIFIGNVSIDDSKNEGYNSGISSSNSNVDFRFSRLGSNKIGDRKCARLLRGKQLSIMRAKTGPKGKCRGFQENEMELNTMKRKNRSLQRRQAEIAVRMKKKRDDMKLTRQNLSNLYINNSSQSQSQSLSKSLTLFDDTNSNLKNNFDFNNDVNDLDLYCSKSNSKFICNSNNSWNNEEKEKKKCGLRRTDINMTDAYPNWNNNSDNVAVDNNANKNNGWP